MSKERKRPRGIPLGTGPGVFGCRGCVVEIYFFRGWIGIPCRDGDGAWQVVTFLRERLKGNSPVAIRLRNEFSREHMLSFLGECLPGVIAPGGPQTSRVPPAQTNA